MREEKNYSKLNFGCGSDIKGDFWNVDIVKLDGCDRSFDFNIFPYNLMDNHYDYIMAKQVFEHVDNIIDVLNELNKKLKDGGVLEISVPYWTSPNAWVHPQHRREFNYETFDFFVKDTFRNKVDGHWTSFNFAQIKKRIFFQKKYLWWNYLIEPIINLSRNSALFYEYSGLHSIFPADGITYILIK